MNELREIIKTGARGLVFGALALGAAVALASTWIGPPPGAPPNNGNVAAPINVGSTAQTKTGTLTVGSLTVNGSMNASGNIIGGNIFAGSAELQSNGDIYMPWAGAWASQYFCRSNGVNCVADNDPAQTSVTLGGTYGVGPAYCNPNLSCGNDFVQSVEVEGINGACVAVALTCRYVYVNGSEL